MLGIRQEPRDNAAKIERKGSKSTPRRKRRMAYYEEEENISFVMETHCDTGEIQRFNVASSGRKLTVKKVKGKEATFKKRKTIPIILTERQRTLLKFLAECPNYRKPTSMEMEEILKYSTSHLWVKTARACVPGLECYISPINDEEYYKMCLKSHGTMLMVMKTNDGLMYTFNEHVSSLKNFTETINLASYVVFLPGKDGYARKWCIDDSFHRMYQRAYWFFESLNHFHRMHVPFVSTLQACYHRSPDANFLPSIYRDDVHCPFSEDSRARYRSSESLLNLLNHITMSEIESHDDSFTYEALIVALNDTKRFQPMHYYVVKETVTFSDEHWVERRIVRYSASGSMTVTADNMDSFSSAPDKTIYLIIDLKPETISFENNIDQIYGKQLFYNAIRQICSMELYGTDVDNVAFSQVYPKNSTETSMKLSLNEFRCKYRSQMRRGGTIEYKGNKRGYHPLYPVLLKNNEVHVTPFEPEESIADECFDLYIKLHGVNQYRTLSSESRLESLFTLGLLKYLLNTHMRGKRKWMITNKSFYFKSSIRLREREYINECDFFDEEMFFQRKKEETRESNVEEDQDEEIAGFSVFQGTKKDKRERQTISDSNMKYYKTINRYHSEFPTIMDDYCLKKSEHKDEEVLMDDVFFEKLFRCSFSKFSKQINIETKENNAFIGSYLMLKCFYEAGCKAEGSSHSLFNSISLNDLAQLFKNAHDFLRFITCAAISLPKATKSTMDDFEPQFSENTCLSSFECSNSNIIVTYSPYLINVVFAFINKRLNSRVDVRWHAKRYRTITDIITDGICTGLKSREVVLLCFIDGAYVICHVYFKYDRWCSYQVPESYRIKLLYTESNDPKINVTCDDLALEVMEECILQKSIYQVKYFTWS